MTDEQAIRVHVVECPSSEDSSLFGTNSLLIVIAVVNLTLIDLPGLTKVAVGKFLGSFTASVD